MFIDPSRFLDIVFYRILYLIGDQSIHHLDYDLGCSQHSHIFHKHCIEYLGTFKSHVSKSKTVGVIVENNYFLESIFNTKWHVIKVS